MSIRLDLALRSSAEPDALVSSVRRDEPVSLPGFRRRSEEELLVELSLSDSTPGRVNEGEGEEKAVAR